jgi:hypothetical protein
VTFEQSTIEDILNGISNSTDTVEFESQFHRLFDYLDLSNELPLHHLRHVTDCANTRIDNISQLSDLHSNVESIYNSFGNLARIYRRYGLYLTGVGILTKLWNKLGEYLPYTISRAGIGYYLGQIYQKEKELGSAIWWLLHAHAADLVVQPSQDYYHKGSAYHLLSLAFDIPAQVFEYMKTCRNKNAESGEPHTLFAEHLVMQLSLESEFAYLFSYPTLHSELPIGRAYAKHMLDRVNKKNKKDRYEGAPLEEFVRYLVLLMSGWIPTKNTYHENSGIDSDVVARYIREPESISSSHPRAILIECKNRKELLDVSEAGYFLYRMSLTQVDVGVLFAKGVTGKRKDPANDKNAQYLLNLAYQQDGKVKVYP